ICIPAYKNVEYLKRLVESISIQTFTNFEVIVTDDSNDNFVSDYVNTKSWNFQLSYFKNKRALGTPENWNEAIRQANGNWIKLVHDDDWFSQPDSLMKFANAINAAPESEFIFSAYNNVYESTNKAEAVFMNRFRERKMLENPVTLVAKNVIGPPSVVLHKNNKQRYYDKNVKWVVDMDFYIRFLQTSKPYYIKEVLINVGVHKEQVTQYTFGVPEVHLKENFYLLNKVGEKNLRNIIVFDAWWRLIRNFTVRDVNQIRSIGYEGRVPGLIVRMIAFQKRIPKVILQQGIFSKFFMTACYLMNKK
ncbi:MAG: glycosyltransferase, partial [Segetibacter sp.]|nr:glycosyltransferase [Segetibacter sp.]